MNDESGAKKGLSREQKTGFFSSSFLAFSRRFWHGTAPQHHLRPVCPVAVSRQADRFDLDEKTRLQLIDTDQDGLNDYEELEFGTSPYLPDTDSDTIGDKAEIDAGTDPACPEGDSGATDAAVGGGANVTPAPLVSTDGIDPVGLVGSSLGGGGDTGAQSSASLSQEEIQALIRDPEALRQLLLQSGKLSKEALDKIDDATLVAFAAQLAAEGQPATSAAPTGAGQ